jgi:Flp pilus assembly protein TadB
MARRCAWCHAKNRGKSPTCRSCGTYFAGSLRRPGSEVTQVRTRAEALRMATEFDEAAAGFANKRRFALAANLDERASSAADDAARMTNAANEFRALAKSLPRKAGRSAGGQRFWRLVCVGIVVAFAALYIHTHLTGSH